MPAPSPIELIRSNFQRRAELSEAIRGIAAAATEENRALTESETADIAERTAQMEACNERITSQIELQVRDEQIGSGIDSMLGAMLNRERNDVVDTRSLGEQFVASDGFEEFARAGGRGQFTRDFAGVSLRALTTIDSSSNVLAGATRLDRIGQNALDRRVFLADLLPVIPVGSSAVEYVQDEVAAAGWDGAEQTEASPKSEATPDFELVTEPIATVAKFTQLTRQVFDDWGQIPGYLDGRLRYGLARRTDSQIASGNGTPPNLKGLGNRSGIATYTALTVEDAATSIRKAVTAGQQAEAVYEIVVINPVDAEKFDLLNMTTAGLHATPDVASAMPRTAWGLTRVVSNAVASGTALLIDPVATAILDREQATARLTDSHASNFVSNILTLLLEARLGLALFDPKGVCKVTFKYT